MPFILQTHHLTKAFQGKEVVSNVNMNVKRGEIYGFLGPNGAGKTTIMKMLMNLVKPTSGEINMFGQRVTNQSYELLKRIGCIIEYPVFYDKLTAKENLDLHCEYMGYYDKKAIDQALDLVNLKNIDNKAVRDFSLGMKQRLGVARAIITKPELLILDEPINGLDPVGIKGLRSLFQMLSKEYGITLLVSSHILGEIELIADTVGVISEGQLVEEVSMKNIKEKNTNYIEISTNDSKKAALVLEDSLNISNYKIIDQSIIRIYESHISQNEVSKSLILQDVFINSINVKKYSLEDYFVALINGGDKNA